MGESGKYRKGPPGALRNVAPLERLGQTGQAIVHCREALRLKPDFLDADYNLGNALAAQGNRAEARAEFAKVLAANPSHAAARQAIESLGN